MLNLLKQPMEPTTFEAWAKMTDDIAKVAILAVPVMLYNNDPVILKVWNLLLLILGSYLFLCGGKFFRRKIKEGNQ